MEIQTKLSKQTVRSNKHNEWQKVSPQLIFVINFSSVLCISVLLHPRNDNFLVVSRKRWIIRRNFFYHLKRSENLRELNSRFKLCKQIAISCLFDAQIINFLWWLFATLFVIIIFHFYYLPRLGPVEAFAPFAVKWKFISHSINFICI